MTNSPTNTADDLVTRLREIIADADADIAGELLDGETTGEPFDPDDWQVEVPVGWLRAAVVALAASPAHATGAAMREAWADAYKAFVGAFDTAVDRRKRNDDYAQDARARMRAFNDMMLAALSSPAPEGEAAQGVEPVAWQPISTAPRDGTEIILFFPTYHEGQVGAYRWKNVAGPEWEGIDGWSFDEGEGGDEAPTHWMPLPAPPSVKQEEAGR